MYEAMTITACVYYNKKVDDKMSAKSMLGELTAAEPHSSSSS
jgi:hypothetical protein